MTTFTALEEGAKRAPSISFNPEHTIADINPLIYGGFTEHMGRCIYGGLYEPSNAHGLADPCTGFRADVLSCMRDELRVPVVRYPGGNFVATYRWQDGIGPKELRPRRPELAWNTTESNQFGTDEFMQWCSEVGCEPYLCLNMGTGTLEDALAWLEYCNGDKDTYWAKLRRKNGHEKPYGVKYWALGNEMWGPWQVEQHTKEDYAKKAVQWAKALKLLDPTIILVLCGRDGCHDWDRYVLQECIRYVDLHSIHYYSQGKTHYQNTSSPYAAERAIQITSSLIDLARCQLDLSSFPDLDRISTAPASKRRPLICFDEWNVWDPVRAPGDQGGEERYTLSDALAVAIWLNIFVRQAKELAMATVAQSVNVISPLMTTETGVWRQTTYWPLMLFAKYMQGKSVSVHVTAPAYRGETFPEWLASTVIVPKIDASAAVDKEGWVNVAVVNVDEEKGFETALEDIKEGAEVQVFVVGGEGHTLDDTNSMEEEKVGVKESNWVAQAGKFVFQRHSFTLLRWKI